MPADLHLLPKFRDRVGYLYVEHAAIDRDQNSITLFQEEGKIQVPVAQIALLMLGPGTRLSHAAVDVLARNNCLICWVGEEGVRLYASGTGGTHSSARLIRQAELISNPVTHMALVRKLYQMRFAEPISPEHSLQQLRGMEGNRVRSAYQRLAAEYGIEWQGRNYDRNRWQGQDPANRALSAANACLYGVCHAAILSLGFSPGLGIIHCGKQLSLVYDLADLYKLELAVPVAFQEAAKPDPKLDSRVRRVLRDRFHETRFLERVAKDLMDLFDVGESEESDILDEDKALPTAWWGEDEQLVGSNDDQPEAGHSG